MAHRQSQTMASGGSIRKKSEFLKRHRAARRQQLNNQIIHRQKTQTTHAREGKTDATEDLG